VATRARPLLTSHRACVLSLHGCLVFRSDPSTIVLKFGSSVLRTPASLPVAVAEVYRHYRDGACVIAVVSAFEGVTDTLWGSARAAGEDLDTAALAAFLSTGEIASAAQLTFALHRAGIGARFLDPRDILLTAEGERAFATLRDVSVNLLNVLLKTTPVLVVPGFFANHETGGLALLGRGGSDLTALYLASELGAGCVLLKDVDGLYESDPARALTPPRRFALADYATAEGCAGPLVQRRALHFARARTLAVDVAQVGSSRHTRIGEAPSVLAPLTRARPIRVALLGLGTVGRGVLDYLQQFPQAFEVVGALVRTPETYVARGVPAALLTTSPDEIVAREPEIVVEALPGIEPARTCVAVFLEARARIVTANKTLLAEYWGALAPDLVGPRRTIRYTATVGGSVPMLETIERLSLRTRIVRLRGVLNGTSNFVLDRCVAGDLLVNAVRCAQAEGLTEADSAEDLSGRDTARKIEVLGRAAFGGSPVCEGVIGITEASGRYADSIGQLRPRLVAEAERTATGFTYRVAPVALPVNHFLAGTRGAENRLEITTADGTVTRLQGLGAGRIPTATAVFADVLEHVRVIEAEQQTGEESASVA
jgi:homoserine dehydrogenase